RKALIGTAHIKAFRTAAPAAPSAPAATAKKIREHIRQIVKALMLPIGIVVRFGIFAVVMPLLTFLPRGVDFTPVKARALFGVPEQFISGGGRLEAIMRDGIRVQVRVVSLGDPSIGPLDVVLTGVLVQPQRLVWIVGHGRVILSSPVIGGT